MKKITLGLIAAMAVSLTSCNMSSEQKASNTLTVCNLVTNLTNNATTASECTYKYELEFSKGTATISGDPVTLDTRNYSFNVSGATLYDGNLFNSGLVVGTIKNVSGNLNGAYESLPIQDAEFKLLPGMLGQQCLYASYRAGNEYLVRTFPGVALYVGKTHTSYPAGMDGTMSSFESTTMSYGVKIDLKNKKADLIIYKAKFSDNPKEPEKSEVLIEGLDFVAENGYYKLVGANITPKIPEGGKYTEYNNFNISQITLQPTGTDMIAATISYKVLHTMTIPGMENDMTVTYEGLFSGSYAYLPEVKP